MIRVEGCSFAYPGESPVLESLSFSVKKGEFLCLAGANGSGKSTLLSLLAGLFTPTAGKVIVNGKISPGMEDKIRSDARLVMQDFDHQILGATPEEDLLLGRDEADPAVRQRVEESARRFGLNECMRHPVQTLSGGQKRKLALCAALLDDPGVLLFDEPFSGLDYPAAKEMRRAFKEHLDQGITQIAAVHDVEPVADLATKWVVLHQGRVAVSGTVDEVFPRLESFGVRKPCAWQPGCIPTPWEAR